MKAVFISDVSPSRGHIYGLRFNSFAAALCRRGHRVVVLSPLHPSEDSPTSVTDLSLRLDAHDWSQPLMITTPPARARMVEWSRSQTLPAVVRRAATGYLLAIEGGVHGDWERGARPLAGALAKVFKPDIVWPVFGNASTLVIAQKMAAQAGAAWMPDIKDNWESYTPRLVRPLLRRRFADAAGYTTNAQLHGDIAERWLGRRGHVVYSGVADVMAAPAGACASKDECLFALVGSTYRPEMLRRFLAAFSNWVAALAPEIRARVRLRYCGSSADMVREVLIDIPLACAVEVTGNVAHDELARICQGAMANCYIWAPFTFHHKMLELLSTRRPAIAFPGEHAESIGLARTVGGDLMACRSEDGLARSFDFLLQRWLQGDVAGAATDLSNFSWVAGAARLEDIFSDAIARHRAGAAL